MKEYLLFVGTTTTHTNILHMMMMKRQTNPCNKFNRTFNHDDEHTHNVYK